MTIVESRPGELVRIKLEFFAVRRHQHCRVQLRAERRWRHRRHLEHERPEQFSRVRCVFVNMDRMVGDMFEQGLAQIKAWWKGGRDGQPRSALELMSKDPAKLSDFYAGIFGWKVQHHPRLNYRAVERRTRRNQRRHRQARPGRSLAGNMLFYILVDDLAKYRKQVVAAGGKIHIEEQKVPGMGKFCFSPTPRAA